jgi:hypothetical protein
MIEWADAQKLQVMGGLQEGDDFLDRFNIAPEFMVIVGSGWHRLESRTSNANHHLPLMAVHHICPI